MLASSYHKDSLESRDRLLKSRSTSVLKISQRCRLKGTHRKHLLISGTRDIIRPISMEHNHLLHFWVHLGPLGCDVSVSLKEGILTKKVEWMSFFKGPLNTLNTIYNVRTTGLVSSTIFDLQKNRSLSI